MNNTEVKSFLTVLGAHIVGTVDVEMPDYWDLEDALFVSLAQQSGGVGVQFSPISLFGKFDPTSRAVNFTLQKIHVVVVEDVNDDILNAYRQATGKIQVANAGNIIDLAGKRP